MMESNRFKILDGGLSTELAEHGYPCDQDPLWSAKWLAKDPQALRAAHTRFLENGADIIATGTYQASIQGFCDHLGLNIEKSKELIRQGVHIAKESRDAFWSKYCADKEQDGGTLPTRKKPLVAGSIGPYGAFLHDGSEYNGSYIPHLTIEELMDWHRPRLSCLVQAEADLIAFETIPAAKEAQALIRLLKEFPNAKAWISFSCKNENETNYGDNLRATAKMCMQEATPGQLVGIGVNCISPDIAQNLIQTLAGLIPPLDVIIYPNSGEKFDVKSGWTSSNAIPSVSTYVPLWIDSGATWIGGCCRVNSKEIRKIKDTVTQIVNKMNNR